jgi:PTS system galactitol-specific IIB component
MGKPVFKGLPFLTGIGRDALIEEIAAALKA